MASAVADEHLIAAETLVAVIPYQAAAFVLVVVAVVVQMVAADVAFEVPAAALLALPLFGIEVAYPSAQVGDPLVHLQVEVDPVHMASALALCFVASVWQ